MIECMNLVWTDLEKEEAAMFPLAEQALAEDLDEMREKMQALNKELMVS